MDFLNLIDTHCHLASPRFSGAVSSVIQRAQEAGVSRLITIACDLEDSATNLQLAREHESVFATVGIHPTYVHELSEDWLEQLTQLVKNEPIAAIGEIGLDYYHPPQDGSPVEEWRALQRRVFEAQLQLAIEHDQTVVIHQRESAADVAAVLRNFPKAKAVLHCFSGTVAEAEVALEMGHYLSFTGVLTFPKAESVREAAAAAPIDRIMVETDSPYLAPVPYRGKQCEPHMVKHTAARLAELHGRSNLEMAEITTQNAERLFGLG